MPLQGKAEAGALSRPFWVPCAARGRACGRLQVQVQVAQSVLPRALKVLVVTWNLGGTPSPDLPLCFPAAPECAPSGLALLHRLVESLC